MISWLSLVVVAVIAGMLLFGWWRGWPMTLTLIATMAVTYVLSMLTAPSITGAVLGSPIVEDLAWRSTYMTDLSAWMHWPTIVTTMFLHSDFLHFLLNIVVFGIMGTGFEERVGRGWILAVFVVTGVAGTVVQSAALFAVAPSLGFTRAAIGTVPIIGASGGVFGVLGAFATAYPRDRVILFVGIIMMAPVYIAASVYAFIEIASFLWFGLRTGVATHAHVGGLLVGVAMALYLVRTGMLERGGKGRARAVRTQAVRELVKTPEQEALYAKLEANLDEPELARAWLERFARATPCPRCGERLEAAKGALRCACGYQLPVEVRRRGNRGGA